MTIYPYLAQHLGDGANKHMLIFLLGVTSGDVVSMQGYGKGDDKGQQKRQAANLRWHKTQEAPTG